MAAKSIRDLLPIIVRWLGSAALLAPILAGDRWLAAQDTDGDREVQDRDQLFRWFEGLGFPNPRDRTFVRVPDGYTTAIDGKTRTPLFQFAFLLKETPESEKGEWASLGESVAKGGYRIEGQVEILVAKYPQSCLPALVRGIEADSTYEHDKYRLLRHIKNVPGDEATPYLKDVALTHKTMNCRFVAAWALHHRGDLAGVEAMLAMWNADEPSPPQTTADLVSFPNRVPTGEVIWFLLNCGKVRTIEAVSSRIGRWDDSILQGAIIDLVFERETYYSLPDCRLMDAAPELRDDRGEILAASVRFLSSFLNNQTPAQNGFYSNSRIWPDWPESGRICDLAAAAINRLDPQRFPFNLAGAARDRDTQMEQIKKTIARP